jgi:Carboxypeptidase regulatory-like domain
MTRTLLFLFLIFSFAAKAQTPSQTVRGKVVDNQTKAALPGVVVILGDSGTAVRSTASDVAGNFRFENVPVGRQLVRFKLLGYRERGMNIVVSAGKEVVLTVELEESVVQSKEVVITAEQQKGKPNNEMSTVSARSFSIEETQRYAGSLGDPSRMAANYAGVSGAQDSRNDVVVRGNSPLGVLWRLNGLDIPNPNHFGSFGSTGGPVSILNNNVLNNSDFMTGAFPAEYGNATAGAFDLKLRNGNNEKFEFLGQVAFNGFEGGIEGPFSKKHNASFLVNYRYSTLGLFSKLGISFGTGTAVPKYQDLSFKLNFPTEKFGTLSIWGIGGLSNIELLDSQRDTSELDLYTIGGFDTYYETRMGVGGITHIMPFSDKTYGRLNIGITLQQNKVRLDSVSFSDNTFWPSYGSNFRQTKITGNYTVVTKFNARNTLKSGVYADLYDFLLLDSTNITATTFRRLRDTKDGTFLLQAYTQWQHKFTDLLTLNTGIHYQQLMLNNSQSIEPRVGLRWQINEKNALSFGSGLHSQMQTIFTYFNQTLQPDGSYLLTNKNLDFTRSAHGVLAWDRTLGSNARIKVEAYYQYLFDVPGLNRAVVYSGLNEGADFNAPGIDSLVNNGKGRNYGIEITAERFYNKGWYFLTTVSLFESKYTSFGSPERNTAFNGNYVVNLLGGKEIKLSSKNMLSFDLRGNAAGGKRYIPIDLAASSLAGEAVYDLNRAYTLRYNDYFRIDLRIGFTRNGKHITQTWAIDLLNITNNKNVFTQEYDADSNSIKTNYQTGFLFIPQYKITF